MTWGIAIDEQGSHGAPVAGCRQCGGAWTASETLDVIIASAARESLPPGVPGSVKKREVARERVVYRKCPLCQQLMARKNFARVSGIVVDECRDHGTFFDAGELEAMLDFVRSGGLHEASRRAAEVRRSESRPTAYPAAVTSIDASEGAFFEPPIVKFVRWVSYWLSS